VSNLNPKLLFGELVDPAALPQDFRDSHSTIAADRARSA
jgi:hypothetical protein